MRGRKGKAKERRRRRRREMERDREREEQETKPHSLISKRVGGARWRLWIYVVMSEMACSSPFEIDALFLLRSEMVDGEW